MKNLKITKKLKNKIAPFVLAETMAMTSTGCRKNYILDSSILDSSIIITIDNEKIIVNSTRTLNHEKGAIFTDNCSNNHWRDVTTGTIYHEGSNECPYSNSGVVNVNIEKKDSLIPYLLQMDLPKDDFTMAELKELYNLINSETNEEKTSEEEKILKKK